MRTSRSSRDHLSLSNPAALRCTDSYVARRSTEVGRERGRPGAVSKIVMSVSFAATTTRSALSSSAMNATINAIAASIRVAADSATSPEMRSVDFSAANDTNDIQRTVSGANGPTELAAVVDALAVFFKSLGHDPRVVRPRFDVARRRFPTRTDELEFSGKAVVSAVGATAHVLAHETERISAIRSGLRRLWPGTFWAHFPMMSRDPLR